MSLKEPPPPYKIDETSPVNPPLSPAIRRILQETAELTLEPQRELWFTDLKINVPETSARPNSLMDDLSQDFSPSSLEAKLRISDLKFAKILLQLVGAKVQEGHLSYVEGSGWGFTFTDDTVTLPRNPPPR